MIFYVSSLTIESKLQGKILIIIIITVIVKTIVTIIIIIIIMFNKSPKVIYKKYAVDNSTSKSI